MVKAYENLKMVVIEGPVYHFKDAYVRDLYSKLLQLKIEGYKTIESRYLAVDETDLIATHFIVTGTYQGEVWPIVSFKGISQRLCNEWKVPFYGLEVIEQAGSSEHSFAMEQFVKKSQEDNIDFGYTASLALDPSIKGNKSLNVEVLKMFECMLCRFHTDFSTKKSTCIGRIATGAPKVLKRVGYQPLSLRGEELPNIIAPKYNNEYQVLVLNEVSEEGRELIQQYEADWDDRLHFYAHENSQSHIDNLYLLNKNKKVS